MSSIMLTTVNTETMETAFFNASVTGFSTLNKLFHILLKICAHDNINLRLRPIWTLNQKIKETSMCIKEWGENSTELLLFASEEQIIFIRYDSSYTTAYSIEKCVLNITDKYMKLMETTCDLYYWLKQYRNYIIDIYWENVTSNETGICIGDIEW